MPPFPCITARLVAGYCKRSESGQDWRVQAARLLRLDNRPQDTTPAITGRYQSLLAKLRWRKIPGEDYGSTNDIASLVDENQGTNSANLQPSSYRRKRAFPARRGVLRASSNSLGSEKDEKSNCHVYSAIFSFGF